jgi:hypothetical protein
VADRYTRRKDWLALPGWGMILVLVGVQVFVSEMLASRFRYLSLQL